MVEDLNLLKEKILVARSIEESEKVRVGLASSLRQKRAAADGTSDQFPGPLGFTNSFITTGLIVQPTCLHVVCARLEVDPMGGG